MKERVIFILLIGFIGGIKASAFSGGKGTSASPYQISSAEEFKEISDNSTAYYVLTSDIADLTPLDITFKGHLDGQGHSVYFNISETLGSNDTGYIAGIFSECVGAEISNLIVNGAIDIKGHYTCGYVKERAWVSNSWTGYTWYVYWYLKEVKIGGICSTAQASTFENCCVKANLKWNPESYKKINSSSEDIYELLSTDSAIGSIAASALDCVFRSCSGHGLIYSHFYNAMYPQYANIQTTWATKTNHSGGLVGYAENCQLTDCYFSGIIEDSEPSYLLGELPSLGGIIGYSQNTTIKNSYFSGTSNFKTYTDDDSRGLIAGRGYLNASQCFSSESDYYTPLFGTDSGTFSKCYSVGYSGSRPNQGQTVDTSLLSMQSWYAQNMPDWDFVNVWYLPSEANSLPLHSKEPEIEYSGEKIYGGSVTLTSQNNNKVLTIETDDPESVEIDNNQVLFKRSGEISVTVNQDAFGEFRKVSKQMIFKVSKQNLKISVNPSQSVYGEDIPEFELICDGFVFNDNIESLDTKLTVLCDATSKHNVGQYPVIVKGAKSDNYNISYTNGIHSIIARTLVAKPRDCSRKYGANNPNFYVEYDGFVNGDNENVVSIQPTTQTSANKLSDVGSYKILCSGGTVSPNYVFEYGVGNLDVEKTNLYVGVRDVTRKVGEPNPKFELTFDSFKNDDDKYSLDEWPVANTEATLMSPVGLYEIYLTGGSDRNYEYKLTSGTLTVIEDSGIENVTMDENPDIKVYTISGVYVGDLISNLPSGIYIVKRGNRVEKVVL